MYLHLYCTDDGAMGHKVANRLHGKQLTIQFFYNVLITSFQNYDFTLFEISPT